MHQPPPRALSILTRILELACLVVVIAWVRTLGGVSLRPVWTNSTTNDTGKLFNWHPIVQTTAFAVLMAEALQAWRSPIIPLPERSVHQYCNSTLRHHQCFLEFNVQNCCCFDAARYIRIDGVFGNAGSSARSFTQCCRQWHCWPCALLCCRFWLPLYFWSNKS